MKCSQAEILLQLAADGELVENEKVVLDEHLSGCVACRRKEAWFEVLAGELEPAFRSAETSESDLADAVVAALRPQIAQTEAPRRVTPTKPKRQKPGLLARAAKGAFKRMFWPAPKAKKATRDTTWVGASLSALQPPPASLDGFRAMRNALSGPVRGVRSVLGRRSRRSGS